MNENPKVIEGYLKLMVLNYSGNTHYTSVKKNGTFQITHLMANTMPSSCFSTDFLGPCSRMRKIHLSLLLRSRLQADK